ncbi:metalloprotease ybeY [Gemmatirosa kalamazoonensis]|uniref:Endoribonuclease YbeY n=1 Tax=Gemmatirosa kalamazoonensis TaxID=861299 RepID=W0RKP2_9BACT|nr:rRNA maturation RNase YbeY [Gemmatirosa kalamazoonensis]AHG90890.1 metalloprotease ybeY [Gemmatirosa kalamazoonensis]
MTDVHVDVATDGVRSPVARERVAQLARDVLRAERVRAAELSITFVAVERMAALNWTHLRHRGPTDIITFELPPAVPGAPVAGDIYIAPDVARENAARAGIGVREEIARLVVHGVLHALGHEHPEDEARTTSPMWRRQERLLDRLWNAREAVR